MSQPDIVSDHVLKVLSKNAGPFWVNVDIFCGTAAAFDHVTARLDDTTIAHLCGATPQLLKRFDIADLSVVKLSFPRPVVQGSATDRVMNGAQWAALIAEMPLAPLHLRGLGHICVRSCETLVRNGSKVGYVTGKAVCAATPIARGLHPFSELSGHERHLTSDYR